MSTYIEFVGVYNFTNSLGGGDGLIKSNILKIKTVNASDTNRVIFSPGIISWNGRLISTQAFVKEGASEGPVPIFIENGLATSMVDTFFIVNPQNIKPLTDGGIIGEGSLGYRSKRGAMIVDSLIIYSGNYSISTKDPDKNILNGNQGYLPFVLISKGRIFIEQGASISASSTSKHGGPGGGGGGGYGPSRDPIGFPPVPVPGEADAPQGDGFTGGKSEVLTFPSPGPFGRGTGIESSSLNRLNASSDFSILRTFSSGVGHPFDLNGSSGGGGQIKIKSGFPPILESFYFGGGGNSTMGSGRIPTIYSDLNGQEVGNKMIIPLHGGGGGAGAALCDSIGGGGGGGISLNSRETIVIGNISAEGGRGRDGARNPGDGLCVDQILRGDASAGGAGGCIIVGSRVGLEVTEASVRGGEPGIKTNTVISSIAGKGGSGRVRFDGLKVKLDNVYPDSTEIFVGLTIDTFSIATKRKFKITGTARPNDSIYVVIKGESQNWNDSLPFKTITNLNSKWSVNVLFPKLDSVYYVVAYQKMNSNDLLFNIDNKKKPLFITTQSATSVIKLFEIPEIYSLKDKNLSLSKCKDIIYDSILVHNNGSLKLNIDKIAISGLSSSEYQIFNNFPIQINPEDSTYIKFQWKNTSNKIEDKSVKFSIFSNDLRVGFNPYDVKINFTKEFFNGTVLSSNYSAGILNLKTSNQVKYTYTNTGTSADTILSITSINSNGFKVNLKSTSFPLVVQPNVKTDIIFDLTPLDTGNFLINFKLQFSPCVFDSLFSIKGYSVSPVILSDTIITISGIECNDTLLGKIFISNKGNSSLKINGVAFAGTGNLNVISPKVVPVTILIGDSLLFDFKIIKVNGVVQGKILFSNNDSNDNKNPYPLNIVNSLKSRPKISNTNINFGVLPTGQSVNTSCILTNLTPTDFIVSNGDIFPPNPDITILAGQIPFNLFSNSNKKINLNYLPTTVTKLSNTYLRLFISLPCFDTLYIPIFGEAFKGGIYLNKTELNFGKVLNCETITDTIVIKNINVKPVKILLLNINPNTTLDWTINPANLAPIDILPNDSIRFTVDFFPVSKNPGNKDVILVIQTDDPNQPEIEVKLIGEKIIENLLYIGEFYDSIIIGKSSVKKHIVKNSGTSIMNITDFQISNPFKIISISKQIPFSLQPNDSVEINIEFTPVNDSEIIDSLRVLTENKCLKKIDFKIIAKGYNPEKINFRAIWQNTTGIVGKTIKIPLKIIGKKPDYVVTLINVNMKFNQTLFKPKQVYVGGTMIHNWSISEITHNKDEIEFTIKGLELDTLISDTILFVEGTILLGDSISSEIFSTNKSTINNGKVNFIINPGELILSNYCVTGGKRLFSGSNNFLLKSIAPNPSTENILLKFESNEDIITKIKLFDDKGKLEKEILNEFIIAGVYELTLNLKDIPSGVYFVELSNENQITRKKIVVYK